MSNGSPTLPSIAIKQLATALGIGVGIGLFILITGIFMYEKGIKPRWQKRRASKKATAVQDVESAKMSSEGESALTKPDASRFTSDDEVSLPGVPERAWMARSDSGRLVMSGAL